MYAGITVSTLAVYIAFTVSVSSWRTKFREDMNRMENRASHEVMESLMNYETVKVRTRVRFGWRDGHCVAHRIVCSLFA